MNNYVRSDWVSQVERTSVPYWKSIAYFLLRPYWNQRVRGSIKPISISKVSNARLISERGYPVSFRRKWATSGIDIGSSTIVVQGTGNGWDVVSWAKLKPKRIIAIDLFEFDTWDEIKLYCGRSYGVPVEFIKSPLETDFGLNSCSVDLVVSDAVYEHCTNLRAVLTETRRILRNKGRVYANYGPLWYCAGGDHFSGRDNVASSYNHILLDKSSYDEYVANNKFANEDYQDGARYIELDLFSKLSTADYLAIYKELGFNVDDLWCEISSRALLLQENYPSIIHDVSNKLPENVYVDDLLIKAHHLRLTK